MFGKKIGGRKRFNMNFCGNNYELVDPSDFLLQLFTMEPRFYPRNWVKLYTINLVGSMGSGKSTAINKIVNIIHSIYGDELKVTKTDDPIYAIENIVDESYFQVLIIDDAITAGMDSRRSMSNENITLSQNYFLARHLAKKKMGKGILFVIFAVQSPTRLDKSIRENADLTIYKNYYRFLNQILDPDSVQYVKDFTREAMLENKLDQLSACLGVDRTDRPIRFYFPEEQPTIEITEALKQPYDISPLINEIMRNYNEEWTDRMLKAYIFHYTKRNQIELSDAQIKEICYCITYMYYFKKDTIPKSETEKKELPIDQKMKLIHQMRKEGLSFRTIGSIFEVTHVTIITQYNKWLKKHTELEVEA
jgi:energy-coupling factor transporter ATP-binding protein EcfA2